MFNGRKLKPYAFNLAIVREQGNQKPSVNPSVKHQKLFHCQQVFSTFPPLLGDTFVSN